MTSTDCDRRRTREGTSNPERALPSSCNLMMFRCLPGSSHQPPLAGGKRHVDPRIKINGTKTRVLVEQLTVVDPQSRLGEFVGRLDGSEMRAVDEALLTLLALD